MNRYHDNEDFVALFRQKLGALSDDHIRRLMSYGQFGATGHSIHTVTDHDQCDDCYSGDTEYEMTQPPSALAAVWRECATELELPVEAPE